MTPRALRAASQRWAATRRYQRLNYAVVGCLLVMFLLSVALTFTIRTIDGDSEAHLAESTVWAEVGGSAEQIVVILGRWSIDPEQARADLTRALDETQHHLANVQGREHADELGEFAAANRRLTRLISVDGSTATDVNIGLASLSLTYAELASTAATLAGDLAREAVTDLGNWFRWIQIVTGGAVVVFTVIVVTAILPLSRSIERSLKKLQNWQDLSARDTARRTLRVQVTDGLDVAETEEKAFAVISRALRVAAPDHAAELLLADSSQAHLRPVAVHPVRGGSGCGVIGPWSCPAVRRGTTMVFDDSKSIRSCPHLAQHEAPCSAVCSPLTFMGQPMGVLHATGPVGETPPKDLVEDLTMVASESATRIGTLRSFAKAELQASTDVLTGLPNRRATEDRLRALVAEINTGAVALIEIAGLIEMNDRDDRAGGDRALKVAAESLQSSCRAGDFVGRWAGGEFVVVVPAASAAAARPFFERMQDDLRAAFDRARLVGIEGHVGIADTHLATSVRGILQLANAALTTLRQGDGSSTVASDEVSTASRP